jgi:hypothetical protein
MTRNSQIEREPELVGPRELSHNELPMISGMRDGRVPVVAAERFNALVASFGDSAPLDPYRVVCGLARCSQEMTALLRADVGLPRPCRLYEHTQGVLDGLERDYIGLFDAASNRRVLRLALLLQDIGKSLCVFVTGSNFEQAQYNVRVAENLLATLTTDTLPPVEQQAVRLLLAHDIIGEAVQGRFDHNQLEKLQAAWPQALEPDFDDLVIVSYLADASAHTEHRSYRDADTLEMAPCTKSDDETLSWLFEADAGGRLALRVPEHRQIVRALFPSLNAVAPLVPPSDGGPVSGTRTSAALFEEVATANGVWSAEFRLMSLPFAELRELLTGFAREHAFPVSAFVRAPRGVARTLTLVRDPSVTFGTPSIATCEAAVDQLVHETGWRREDPAGTSDGFMVGLGLRKGYDEQAPTRPAYAALARLLRNAGEWGTNTVWLVSARNVDGDVQWYEERGIVIHSSAGLLPIVADLAHEFGQQRFAVTDADEGRTYALRRRRPADA